MANYSKEELQYIASQVKPYLLELVRANGLDVDNIEVVEDTDGITSLPAYDNRGGTKKVVRVPISTFAKPAQDAADELIGNITAAGEAANNANIAAEKANTAASEISSLKGSIEQAVDDAQKALVDSQTALENITQKAVELDESEASRSEAEQSRNEAEQLRISEFDSLKTQMTASIEELDAATESAIDTAEHPTYIGEDNYVYKWNKEAKSYNKTDIYVRGEGFSISKVWSSKEAQSADTSSYKEGSFGLINTGDVENSDNAQLFVYNNGKWEFLVDMSGAIGFTGKTPQLSIGNVAKGTEAAVSLSEDGTDADGNPKYKLNLVLPQGDKGDDGLEPILEMGSVVTSAPNTSASAEIIENGFSINGNPKYILNLTIPKGEKGENGEGAGNVLVDTSNLVSGKTYLFKPNQNNSAEGTFVEYEPQQIDTSTLATKAELSNGLGEKQDVIEDLKEIREGASKGATAIQEELYKGTIAAVDTDESVDDPNIPSGSYDDTEIKAQIKENADNIVANKADADAKLSELGQKVDEISKSISPTITNLQTDGLLDSLDKIKTTYHDPILSLYDGGIKVNPSLDSSKPYPNIYLEEIGTLDKDETYLVLVDIYNIGGYFLQFYLGKDPYLQVVLEKKRKVIENIVTIPAGTWTQFRLQNLNQSGGEYVIYAVMVFKVPDNIPSDEFQRNILNYYNTVGYKQSYGGVMDSDHSNSASVADRLKVKDIELWGDSLTEQNYGKYILGANVSVNGFGGKTSTYIRDKFLSDADKKDTQVIWVGRNNYNETDVVIDDIRDMVSALEHNNFIIMCPPNGYYGTFGTNGSDGTGEMKGGSAYSKFLELETRLSEEYPSNFLNIRKAVIEGWRMGNVKLLSDFVQPSVGGNVTIEVSDAAFLTTYNGYDVSSFGEDFMSKIRIGVNGEYDVYKIVEKVDDTHLTVQLEEINRISSGNTVGNIVDGGGTNAIKYLRVMQNADYMCWLYDTTLSTFRKDGIHMTEDGLKLVAQIVSRKLASMKLL